MSKANWHGRKVLKAILSGVLKPIFDKDVIETTRWKSDQRRKLDTEKKIG